ncbi:MAG: NUDIX hydrolase [Bryobacteraceae bacterium]
MKPLRTEIAFHTPWFELRAKTMREGEPPYYSVRPPDYTAAIALTADRRVVMVRQYRPAVERYTLELPSGLVDPGETPEQAMRRELLEETGYEAGELEPLGTMIPDAGRLETRIWNFFAPQVKPAAGRSPEEGIEVRLFPLPVLANMIVTGEFDHALHVAAFLPALLAGKLKL